MGPPPSTSRAEKGSHTHRPFHARVEIGTPIVFVERLRSAQHGMPKTRGAYRVLGLDRKRRRNILPDRADVWGSVRKVPAHRLRVVRTVYGSHEAVLLCPEYHSRLGPAFRPSDSPRIASVPEATQSELRKSGTVVSVDYAAGSAKGLRLTVRGGGAVRLERYKESSTVLWPTTLRVDQFMERAQHVLGVKDAEIVVYVEGKTEPLYFDMRDLAEAAMKLGNEIHVARAINRERHMAVGWQRSVDSPGKVEGAMTADEVSLDDLSELLNATATKAMSAHSKELLEKIQGALKI